MRASKWSSWDRSAAEFGVRTDEEAAGLAFDVLLLLPEFPLPPVLYG